jgi:hypothetical protein
MRRKQKEQHTLVLIVAVVLVIAVGIGAYMGAFNIASEGTAPDKVDDIPDVSVDECLSAIKEANPDMSEQDAMDNCYTIEAVNKADASLCDLVSEDFRPNCLAQLG